MQIHPGDDRQDEVRVIQVGDLAIDLDKGLIRYPDGSETLLSLRQCELLRALIRERGRVLSYAALGFEVWQYPEHYCSSGEIHSCVWRLRQKLGSAAGAIQTVRNVGYCFRCPTPASSAVVEQEIGSER